MWAVSYEQKNELEFVHSQEKNILNNPISPIMFFPMVSFSHNQIPYPVQSRDKYDPASICSAPFKKLGTLPINLELLWLKPLAFRKM